MLTEAHTFIFVNDTTHLHDLALLQTKLILVPDHLGCGGVLALRDLQLVIADALNSAHEGDGTPDKALQVSGSHERVWLTMHVFYFFTHCLTVLVFLLFDYFLSNFVFINLLIGLKLKVVSANEYSQLGITNFKDRLLDFLSDSQF